MSDMEMGDCSTDGTCEDQSGGEETSGPIEGVKLSNTTLLEETTLALQQFSVGKMAADDFGVSFTLNLRVTKVGPRKKLVSAGRKKRPQSTRPSRRCAVLLSLC